MAFLDRFDVLAALTLASGAALTTWLWRRRSRRAIAAWCLVIVFVSFPFESFQTHAHWDKIGWIPFYSWPVRIPDILGNVALYFPLGFLALRRRSHPPYLVVALAAFALSLAMETIQDFSHSRFPAATDLVCNVSGALLGLFVASRQSVASGFSRT